MEDLSMFQTPRTVALEDENPGTYGTVLIYPLNRLVTVASWVTRLLILGFASSVDARLSPERVLIYPLDRLGISGVYGDTSDISIHGLAPLLSDSLYLCS
ncbi:hypothetical protein PIB30_049331 [Stylosanthes scabra]|uniref:Uncharacterized protein n=1 Tax=Stylosanthes scabra TaxID=79078 RepID=A0ABU6XII8_9FABA|nr:hypothetical protein [Stylosanthes scabra]